MTKAAREQVAACGARVAGIIPDRALLVEADEAALARLASSAAFAGACELTPADKVAANLAKAEDEADVTLIRCQSGTLLPLLLASAYACSIRWRGFRSGGCSRTKPIG